MHWKRLTAVGLVVLIGISMALALLGDSTPLDLDAIDTTGVDGALVFANSCAVCHGRGLRGTSSGRSVWVFGSTIGNSATCDRSKA